MDDRAQLGPADEDESSAAASGEREARRDALRAAVKQGLEDIEAGRVVDLDSALDRIEAMLDEMESAKRA
jgi:predicted transcriptional regulator